MKIFMMLLSLLWTGLVCGSELRRYQAAIDASKWHSDGTRLICRLTHDVPLFGRGEFSSRAHRDQNVTFDLIGRYQASQMPAVDLRILPAMWQPGLPSQKVKTVPQQGEISFLTDTAWRMLSALETGKVPAIFFHDANIPEEEIQVSLLSVNFIKEYGAFRDCMAQLLNYNFGDIERSDLFFEFDKFNFTEETLERLEQIRTYLTLDPELDSVWIYGYADSKGGRTYNQKLSENRANAVRDYFIDQIGVAPDAVHVMAKGETKPFENNVTAEGRSYNRRVTIRLVK